MKCDVEAKDNQVYIKLPKSWVKLYELKSTNSFQGGIEEKQNHVIIRLVAKL